MAAYIAAVSTFPWEPLMRVVHVRIARADLAKSLGEMREWLDRHKTPLVRFETQMHRSTIMIKFNWTATIWRNSSGKRSEVLMSIRG